MGNEEVRYVDRDWGMRELGTLDRKRRYAAFEMLVRSNEGKCDME